MVVYLDGTPAITLNYDLVQQIFGGQPVVEWGFTCSQSVAVLPTTDPNLEVRAPNVHMYFGAIQPAFTTRPKLDTCFNNPVQFFDRSNYDLDSFFNSVQLARWYWDFGNGQVSNVRNPPPVTYPAPGKYVVKYTVTNQIGCTVDTLKQTIILGSKPVASFDTKGFCAGDSIQLLDKSNSAFGDLVQWTWIHHAPGRITPGKPAKIVFDSSGIYPVSLVVQTHLNCRSDTVTKMVKVEGKPVVDFSYRKDCLGAIQYTGQLLDTTHVQRWYYNLGDGYFSILRDSVHAYQRDGDYWIRLVAYSGYGCGSDTVVKPVHIERVFAFAGNDTIVAAGQPLHFNSRTSSNQVSWTPATGLNDPFLFSQPLCCSRIRLIFSKSPTPMDAKQKTQFLSAFLKKKHCTCRTCLHQMATA